MPYIVNSCSNFHSSLLVVLQLNTVQSAALQCFCAFWTVIILKSALYRVNYLCIDACSYCRCILCILHLLPHHVRQSTVSGSLFFSSMKTFAINCFKISNFY